MPAINLLHIPPEEILLRPSIDVAFVGAHLMCYVVRLRTINQLPI